MLTRHLHHVALAVADLDATLRWYEDTLDFRLERRFYLPDPGIDIAYLTAGPGVRIELLCHTGRAAAPPGGPPDLLAPGARHICFEVDDLDAAADTLRRRGVPFTQEPKVIEAAGVKNFWIADNTGSAIEFIEQLRSESAASDEVPPVW
jgi:catechol 2,3-dioxygenase-like lactoylglutathione lyase family enzyme